MSSRLEELNNFYDHLKNEFVPLELALLLKNKGFNKNCLGFYVGKEEIPHLIDEKIVPITNFKLSSKVSTRAPLYQEVFDWFRTEYRLDGTVRQIDWTGRSYWNIKKIETEDKIKGYSKFTISYKAAKIECIKKLIELI